ncbi:MAG: GAF domain-containing protein [Anaerolineae bacterium]|nr:GAF domain-containing protein [Anaerolineae bacterium]
MSEKQKGAYSTEIREWQHELLNWVLRIVFIVAIPALLIAAYYVWKDGRAWLIPFYALSFVILGFVRFSKKASYALQTGTLLTIVYGLVVLSLVRAGLSSNARIFLLSFSFIATIFLGRRAALASIAVVVITMGIAGWLFSAGVWAIPADVQVLSDKPTAWLSYTFTLLLVSTFFMTSQLYLFPRLAEALVQSQDLARELTADRERAVREAEIKQRHAEQLGWVANLGHVLASLRQRDELIWRVVREIAQTFDIYQANLFLINRSGDMLLLAATSGQLGEELARSGTATATEILVGARSAPGRAAQLGREQMALPSPEELPQFPDSRVEISLPLSVRGEVLGVLDLHSTRPAFPDEELQIFRIIASQVTTALDMLRSLEETQIQVQETRALYAQHTLASWRTLLGLAPVQSAVGVQVAASQVTVLAQKALAEKEPRSTRLNADGVYLLVVPLVARDVALGYLAFTRAAEKGDWNTDACSMIMMAAERLAVALDNTRLLVEARRQALYDERLSQLGDLIWQTPSPEVIMEQSVRELGRFLGASEAQLYLTPEGVGRRGTRPLQPPGEQNTSAVSRAEKI